MTCTFDYDPDWCRFIGGLDTSLLSDFFFFSNMKPPLKTFFFYSFRSIRSVYQENLDKQPNFLLGKTIRGSWNTRVKKAQQQHIWNASRRRKKKKAHIICSHIIFSLENRKKFLLEWGHFFTSKATGKDAGRRNLVPKYYLLLRALFEQNRSIALLLCMETVYLSW